MSKVKTVNVIDPRIEPQEDPVYAVTTSPQQNQFYKIPQSGLSDSYVTFNNMTTLGADRAYLDTFELEITFTAKFKIKENRLTGGTSLRPLIKKEDFLVDSFPFNKCCEQVKVNINGGAFFSQPMAYIRAKERYWDERKLADSYGNVTPTNKPWLQNEAGWWTSAADTCAFPNYSTIDSEVNGPSRMNPHRGYNSFPTGPNGSYNNDILTRFEIEFSAPGSSREQTVEIQMTYREPIFASPFSSRYDATYGRPLYNITSMDIAFNLQNLNNMFKYKYSGAGGIYDLEVHLKNVQLCYQVMTLPSSVPRPPSTVVPYRRFVPYVTEFPQNPVPYTSSSMNFIDIRSGVYTLNEIPTAIWIFLGPTKDLLQNDPIDGWHVPGDMSEDYRDEIFPSKCYNKLFGLLEHINISCANTTQILDTASVYDLYRIARANGCKDSFTSWGRRTMYTTGSATETLTGAGSVLRLIPGTDIVLPDQPLIPGANANNIVFQVEGRFGVPSSVPPNYRNVALWVLFEYVGVATITPGQCEIQMNPLGNGRVMASAPVISSTEVTPTETVEGSGWLDSIKNTLGNVWKYAKQNKLLSKGLKMIPGVGETASQIAETMGYGYKRPRDVSGGAVMGMGDFC